MNKIDLFKLLRLRAYHSYAELSQEERDRMTFFKESVDALEYYSKFVDDVIGDKNSILKAFEINYKNGIDDFGEDVRYYFNKLNKLSNFIPNIDCKFGQDVIPYGLFEFLSQIKGNEIPYFCDKTPSQNFSARYMVELINWIRGNKGSIDWNRSSDDKLFWSEFCNLCTGFDAIITNHLDIKILCLDINLKNNYKDNCENFRRINWGYVSKIHNYLNDFPDFIHGFFKYENDHQFGLNLQCILFFEGKGKLNTKAKIEKLKEKIIRDKFESGIQISDWLVQLKKITQQDFSKISYFQQERIQNFKYWVLGYYTYIDRIIKLECKDSQNDFLPINNVFLKQDRSVSIDPQEAYRKHIKFWQNLIEGKNPQKIWQCQNLNRNAIERIAVTELVYKEYAKSDTRFADLADVGVRLEIFIENLLASNGGLFDFPRHYTDFNSLTTDELTYSITRACQQYFSLLDEQDKIQRLLKYSSDEMTSFLLKSITVQLSVFFSRCVVDDKFNLDFQKINELNVNSLKLKKRYQLQTYQDGSLKIRTNQVSQNFNKSEANIIQHKICARRYATAIDYLDQMFTQDLVVYRIQFRVERNWGALSQEEFSTLFTSFIRFSKRSKPLSMSTGYLGSWNVGYESKTSADVLFFFPRTKLEQLDEVGVSIIKYWDRFLNNHIQAKINREPLDIINPTECIEIFLSQPEFSSKYVVFAANDKKKQRLFKNTIVKYLCYKEIFQPKPAAPIRKVLIKGSTAKMIKVNN